MGNFDGSLVRSRSTAPFDLTEVASCVLDDRGRIVSWTHGAQAVLGYPAGEVLERPAARLLVDEGEATRVLDCVQERLSPEGWGGVVTVRHRDGRWIPLTVRASPLTTVGGDQHWLVVALEIDQAPWSQVNHSMLEQFLAQSPVGMAVMGPDLRYTWLNDAMERLSGDSRAERLGKRLREVVPGLDVDAIESTMRRVLTTGEPVVDFEYRGFPPADPHREHAYSTSFFRLDDISGRVLGVCCVITEVTDRWRSRQRLALLNEVGARTGSTLDISDTAQKLAELGVPRLADFVGVDLLDTVWDGQAPGTPPRGTPSRGTLALRRTGMKSVLANDADAIAAVGEVIAVSPSSPWEECLVEGTPYLKPVVDAEEDGWLADDTLRAARHLDLGLHSLMLVPVIARSTVLGVVTFIRWQRSAPFAQDDLLLAEAVVARAAMHIDNACRFTLEHSIAVALQRDLLPKELTSSDTVEVASRYLPAQATKAMGGDWFDMIPLSGARVALVVGEVVGHGINAIAIMGRFRTAVRTLASTDVPPDELLARLDDLVLTVSGPQREAALGASCLYMVYDPVSRKCVMARAGHPPPAIVAPDHSVTFPDLPAGPPLGLSALPFEAMECELEEGSILALFTDGLIETHGQDAEVGMARLRMALSQFGMPLDELCGAVVDTMVTDTRDDDAALLLARTQRLASDHVASWDLPSDPSIVAEARTLTTRCLGDWGLSDLAINTELIVSELVTNAIRYGAGPIRLRLIRQAALICEVSDASSTSPRLRHARTTDEGGRGLFLVAQMAHRWGTRYTHEGKIIWADITSATD
ncbi:SpoIIE family protein phosphatase [Streptomyces sioyaensis]|uniref:SpoIIE family protein phosphatase n=1 Tax=Streptomyces sioyaensis TaxID=67364 RepID=UPI0037D83456